MAERRFEWDPTKGAANKRKHGVAFEEAESVFADDHGLLIDDPDHSDAEDARKASRSEQRRSNDRWRR